MTQDGEADRDGASISVATVVLPAAAAAVTVPIREGKADEGTSLIVTEGSEGDIDVVRETTGGEEDHVPRDCRRSYSDDQPRSQALASWEVAFFLPPSPNLTPGARLVWTVAFAATVPVRLRSPSSSSDSD